MKSPCNKVAFPSWVLVAALLFQACGKASAESTVTAATEDLASPNDALESRDTNHFVTFVSDESFLSSSILNSSNSRYLQDTCAATSGCIDCVCCGPGTEWDGQQCNLSAAGTPPAAADLCEARTVVENGGCFADWVCLGSDCCAPRTVSVVDPTRPAEASYCVPEDDGGIVPTAASTPSPTTAPTIEPCNMPVTVECVVLATGVPCSEERCSDGYDKQVSYTVEVCDGGFGTFALEEVKLEHTKNGYDPKVVSFELSPDDILIGGSCMQFEHTSKIDFCDCGGKTFTATASASAEWIGGEGTIPGGCSDSDTIESIAPTCEPTGSPTVSPTTQPCEFFVYLEYNFVSNDEGSCLRQVEYVLYGDASGGLYDGAETATVKLLRDGVEIDSQELSLAKDPSEIQTPYEAWPYGPVRSTLDVCEPGQYQLIGEVYASALPGCGFHPTCNYDLRSGTLEWTQ
jgi:hypothetical protein